jgi:hypothetical protein
MEVWILPVDSRIVAAQERLLREIATKIPASAPQRA